MKKTLLLILTLSLTFYLKGQDPKPPRDVYFFLGIGLPIIKVRDEAHSSLKYQGFMPTLRVGYEEINRNHVSRIAVSASFGTAAPKTNPKPQQNISNLEVNNIQVNYTYYQRSGAFNTEGWNQYFGGAFTMTIDMRSYNFVVVKNNAAQKPFTIKAIDFDQQCYEGKLNLYLPQFYKENFRYVQLAKALLTDTAIDKIRMKERKELAGLFIKNKQQLSALLQVMEKEEISEHYKVVSLRKELNQYHHTHAFSHCKTMGSLVQQQLEQVLR